MAMRFINLGKEIYSNDPGYDLFAAEIAKRAGNQSDFKQYMNDYLEAIGPAEHLNSDYREELVDWYNYLLED